MKETGECVATDSSGQINSNSPESPVIMAISSSQKIFVIRDQLFDSQLPEKYDGD